MHRAAFSSLPYFSRSSSSTYSRYRYIPASTLTTNTNTNTTTSTTTMHRWSSSNTTTSDEDDKKNNNNESTLEPVEPSSSEVRKSRIRIAKTLGKHVWPSDDSPESKSRKQRVVFALSLMMAGKAVNIQVPYIFKSLVDALQIYTANAIDAANTLTSLSTDTTTNAALDLTTVTTATGIPLIAILLGYGMSRGAASGFQELRNAVFANVTQEAIRKVGQSVFQHVHSLDMQFHLTSKTGNLSRILDRGNRSISFVLNAMVFHIAPTTVEVGLVTGLVYFQFGTPHACVVLATIAAYTGYTTAITQWRTQFRRDMNRLENQASGRVVDSLVNYETVQFFSNVPHEV
jgi:ATP-binding cassette subfamily B (MDR/TAP) protein 7